MANKDKRTCFVISPIGESSSPTRQRADLVYDFVIAEVLSNDPFNFIIERSDRLGDPGIITNQIIERVIDADLVVADLSERNPNVFYELAVRHIAQKPFVHIISNVEDIPFDNAAARAIPVDVTDLRSVDQAKKVLASATLSALREGAAIESPVSIAVTLKSLKSSGDAEASILTNISAQLNTLQAAMHGLSRRVDKLTPAPLSPARSIPHVTNALQNIDFDAIEEALGGFHSSIKTNELGAVLGSLAPAGIGSKANLSTQRRTGQTKK